MGSTLTFEPRLTDRNANDRQQMRRRDSVNRPVLKLQICSSTMDRHHRIHGETSLDNPFLRRLSGKKYGIASPVDTDQTTGHSITTPSSQSISPNETSMESTTAKAASRPPSLNKQISPSNSMIILQFVDKGYLPNEEHFSTLSFDTGRHRAANEYDPLCLVRYGRIVSSGSDTSFVASRNEYPDNICNEEEHHLNLPDIKHRLLKHSKITETSSTTLDLDFSQTGTDKQQVTRRLSKKASVTITKRLTRTTSLQSELASNCSNYDMCIELQEDNWTFGESVMKSLEEEGILLFNTDNPTSRSEKVIDETWPLLKQKMHKWRSRQSLLDLSTSGI